MNIAADHAWFAKDKWAIEQSNRWLKFFLKEGISSYGNEYTVDGKRLGSNHSLGLVAMNAVACLAADLPERSQFLKHLWSAMPPSGQWRYYDGLLYFLGLLHVSGKFRIYPPPGM